MQTLIFAGAGASKAVNGDKFPTTIEFFERLPEEISGNRLFRFVLAYLRKQDAERVIDIEEILWELEKMRQLGDDFELHYGIIGHALSHNRLANSFLGSGHNFGHLDAAINRMHSECKTLMADINAQVYQHYNYEPEIKELEDNWTFLLNSLENRKTQYNIFTTNYDVSIETAASLIDTIQDDEFFGLQGRRKKKLDIDRWVNASERTSLLTKLHGSIDWQWSQKEILVGAPIFTGNHANHAIIYPGFKGDAGREFFRPLHDYLGDQLERSNQILFVGFAFRDDYINRLIGERVDRNANIVIINPDKSVKFPITRRKVTYINLGFGIESIKKALAK